MATKGYRSYHGRTSAKTVILIAALVLVILLAGGYLYAQNHMVYDDDGTSHIEFPFAKKEKKTSGIPQDISLDIQEPEDALHTVSLLQAQQLADNALVYGDPAALLEENPGALVIPAKLVNGGITYATTADIPAQVGREKEPSLQNLKTLLAADRYTVAQLSCFCDSYFVRAEHSAAFLLNTGSYWYDSQGWTWIDPGAEETAAYITTLCGELADLGFDEILLDYYSYPTVGNTAAIANLAEEQRVQVLTAFAQTLRQALPEDVNLSVVLRSAVSEEFGLSYELLTTCFDRIYVADGADRDALLQQLPEDYDAQNRIVTMSDNPVEDASYVVLYQKPVVEQENLLY